VSERIAFLGSGVMAEAMIRGLLAEGGADAGDLWASGPREERARQLHETYGVRAVTDNLEAVANADLVVLSVKPPSLPGLLAQIRPALRPEQPVVSIVAGARLSMLAAALGHPAIVRCIPNLPCRVGRGLTAWTAAQEVSEEACASVRRLLGALGEEIRVADDHELDRATAVYGTAPALVALFAKALEDAAVFAGEPRSRARGLLLRSLVGTAEMMLASDEHPAELVDTVTSPEGVMSRARHVLDSGGFSALLTDAVDAALRRTVELGDRLEERGKL
jgi:pyrroline-5-carboxylate reductase